MSEEKAQKFETECKNCKEPIVMMLMTTGKWHPCNPERYAVEDKTGATHTALRSHFGTCSARDDNRTQYREDNKPAPKPAEPPAQNDDDLPF